MDKNGRNYFVLGVTFQDAVINCLPSARLFRVSIQTLLCLLEEYLHLMALFDRINLTTGGGGGGREACGVEGTWRGFQLPL